MLEVAVHYLDHLPAFPPSSPVDCSSAALLFTASLVVIAACLLSISFSRDSRDKAEDGETKQKEVKLLRGPRPLPILGSLHLLANHRIPFAGFSNLISEFGSVFSIRLGTTDCVVVNTTETRDEVLIAKANDFDGRPDFERFRKLFGGDKQNALAFCDFSPEQAARREMLQNFTFPHARSQNWNKMDFLCQDEAEYLVRYINQAIDTRRRAVLDVKSIILKACANIFNRYFCDNVHSDYDDESFCQYVEHFDRIFWEVNTGRICDFIPALTPLAFYPIMQSKRSANVVRRFVDQHLIQPRIEFLKTNHTDDSSGVFLDSLLPILNGEKDSGNHLLDYEKAMYALEDILGGFEAVSSMTVRILRDLSDHPLTQTQVHAEIARVDDSSDCESSLSLKSGPYLHWTRAALFETVRLTCSPIVPHRATKNTSINGYQVKKDTVVFVNNHELSFSEKYWREGSTEKYMPCRFLKMDKNSSSSPDSTPACSDSEECDSAAMTSSTSLADPSKLRFRRPWHFKPFSHGKRACMGYKMVENVCQVMTVAMIKEFELATPEGSPKLPVGLLGLPIEPVYLAIKKRKIA